MVIGNFHSNSLVEKVSFQTSLKINPSRSFYICLLDVNFENLIVELHVLILSPVLVKIHEDQRTITMPLFKCFNFIFL